jgi:hypothetical protein
VLLVPETLPVSVLDMALALARAFLDDVTADRHLRVLSAYRAVVLCPALFHVHFP